MTVVNSNAVTFSGKTKLRIGKYGTNRGSLPLVGLIAQGASLNLEQTLRTKKDGFPEVDVAQAIQAQAGTLETQLMEYRKENIATAFGLYLDTDVTETVGADVAVTNEVITFNANGVAALNRPRKTSVAIVVEPVGGGTAYTIATDYTVVDRDLEGRTLIQRVSGGTIPAGGSVQVDYTYTGVAKEEYKIGKLSVVRYFSAELEEELTNGQIRKIYIPRCVVSLRGALNFNAVQDGGELPIRISAVQDSALDYLLLHEHLTP
ncbi:MAG: hypothetical protein HC933_02200 [Pleurocapsa sp. SU_196_0]|nr:hypothetical protein [Pleurocapsa sp. SU_196_0]